MRTVNDVPMGGNSWPPAGKHLCRCTDAKPWTSPKKQTPAVMLTWVTRDGAYQFEDAVFVTSKAIGRLHLVAKRVCQIPGDTELPDDDLNAAKVFARYIADNAKGKDALVTIEEQEEQFVVREGPDMGQTRTTTRHRVAFGGYESPTEENGGIDGAPPPEDENIPF